MKYFRVPSARFLFLALYVISNVAAVVIMLTTGRQIGDQIGLGVTEPYTLIEAGVMIVLSYVFMMGVVFPLFDRISVRPIRLPLRRLALGGRLGQILLVLQIGYFAFNSITGVNVAGNVTVAAGNPLSYFFTLIRPDMLFILYYAVFRGTKYWFANLVIWIISNLYRAWAGIFIFILFIEFSRLIRQHRIRYRHLFISAIVVLTLLPFLNIAKFTIRDAGSLNRLGFNDFASTIINAVSKQDPIDLIGDGATYVVGRLQTTSNLSEAIKLKNVLSAQYDDGSFNPFWMEGIFGAAAERLTGSPRAHDLSAMLPVYDGLELSTPVGGWNINPGFLSWFYVSPLLGVLFLLYITVFGFISTIIMKKITNNPEAMDGIWIAWLVFMMPPWTGVFVSFVYTEAVFLFLVIVCATLTILPRRRVYASCDIKT